MMSMSAHAGNAAPPASPLSWLLVSPLLGAWPGPNGGVSYGRGGGGDGDGLVLLVPPPPPSAHAEPRDGIVVSSYVIDVEAEEEEGGGDEPTGRSRTRRGRLVGEINLLMAEALRQMARRAIVEYDEFLQASVPVGWG